MKKGWEYHLTWGQGKLSKSGGGWMQPGKCYNSLFEIYIHGMVLNLTVYMLETSFPSFKSNKPGEIPICVERFWQKIQFTL